MIKTTQILLNELKAYSSPNDKIARMEKAGEIYKVVKGLYETDRDTSPYLLASCIYGPSYVSFEYALSYHGLIPEMVHVITCASYDKKKNKSYENIFGRYTYRDVPKEVFHLGVDLREEKGYGYLIASPEKALCDQLYKMPPVANYEELKQLLFLDLRIDKSELMRLSREDFKYYSEKYGSRNVKKLAGYMRKIR